MNAGYRAIAELAARGVVRGLRSKPGATVIELDTGPTADARAQAVAGEHNILSPRYDTRLYRPLATEQVNPADPPAIAATLTRLLDTHGGTVDAVLTTNDTVAQTATTVLRQRGLAGKTTITGYGTSVPALKAVLGGEQFLTSYIPPATQADKAAALATALVPRDQATIDRLAPPGRPGQPRTLLAVAAAVTLINIDDVFNSCIVYSADVCDKTLRPRCNELSIP